MLGLIQKPIRPANHFVRPGHPHHHQSLGLRPNSRLETIIGEPTPSQVSGSFAKTFGQQIPVLQIETTPCPRSPFAPSNWYKVSSEAPASLPKFICVSDMFESLFLNNPSFNEPGAQRILGYHETNATCSVNTDDLAASVITLAELYAQILLQHQCFSDDLLVGGNFNVAHVRDSQGLIQRVYLFGATNALTITAGTTLGALKFPADSRLLTPTKIASLGPYFVHGQVV